MDLRVATPTGCPMNAELGKNISKPIASVKHYPTSVTNEKPVHLLVLIIKAMLYSIHF